MRTASREGPEHETAMRQMKMRQRDGAKVLLIRTIIGIEPGGAREKKKETCRHPAEVQPDDGKE